METAPFGASVLTQLVFHPKVVAITGQGSRYARLAFSKGVKKLNDNFTGGIYRVSKKTLNNLTGAIPKRVLDASNNADAAIISRVKELRGMRWSSFDGHKKVLNLCSNGKESKSKFKTGTSSV
jgi:hypothetical protein